MINIIAVTGIIALASFVGIIYGICIADEEWRNLTITEFKKARAAQRKGRSK